ncbi:hypothetical protein Q6A89_00225 [Aliarcobacter skirrowii]|uniref:hypothetical protein n=1 Tax=Aliarcobacter skirrowii TaxID=28200 RepID=UPI0029AA0E49|nr:hypothetical protein [Aliarcobacter skirrowii]MDX4058934.1 hypothetical protein [Aliarcobacter skirrowii]
MEKQNNSLKSTIISIVVVLFIVSSYFLIDFNQLIQSFKGDVDYVTQDSSCNLKKESCKIVIQDGTEFILSVDPKEIPLMKEITFSIKSNNPNLKNLTLNIYSTTMYMGEYFLDIKNLGDGNYEAIGTLPTCYVDNMKWYADIIVDKTTHSIGARFQFETRI